MLYHYLPPSHTPTGLEKTLEWSCVCLCVALVLLPFFRCYYLLFFCVYFFFFFFLIELTTHVLRRPSCARSLFSAFGAKADDPHISSTYIFCCLLFIFSFCLRPCCCLFIFIYRMGLIFFPIFYCFVCCCNAERARSSKNDKSTIMGVMGCHEWSGPPETRARVTYQRYRYARYLFNVHDCLKQFPVGNTLRINGFNSANEPKIIIIPRT